MTKEMFEEITTWQKATFTTATPHTALNHLTEEIGELDYEIHEGRTFAGHEEKIKAEFADCFLLLFGAAALHGLTYEQICEAINSKMEINKQRTWGKPNAEGYVKHIEP